MSIFIKSGLWANKKIGYKGELNLSDLISQLIPVSPTTTTTTTAAPVAPYKVYTALLTQTGTNPPVPTILYNNTELQINWTYSNIGAYSFDITNVQSTQIVTVDVSSKLGIYGNTITYGYTTNLNTVNGFITVGSSGPGANSAMEKQLFEIRVYN